jgi:serine/threonine protein kinase
MIGKTIAHYQVLEKLGEGGMGVVYKARDGHLDRFVALKVLPADKVSDPERRRRFVQEAKAASALNHRNIVTIYDISNWEGTDFIAMEYVPGKTLDQVIGLGVLRLSEALRYAIQIADALAKAHLAGIVHRDLKPSNVMVTPDGIVKVLDFGLAKLLERTGSEFAPTETIAVDRPESTEAGVILGTLAYMSPEQAEGRPVDARSDIFSFGAVLYEMVAGRRAFRRYRMLAWAAILREDPAPLRDGPGCAQRVGKNRGPLPAQRSRAAISRHDRRQGGFGRD